MEFRTHLGVPSVSRGPVEQGRDEFGARSLAGQPAVRLDEPADLAEDLPSEPVTRAGQRPPLPEWRPKPSA